MISFWAESPRCHETRQDKTKQRNKWKNHPKRSQATEQQTRKCLCYKFIDTERCCAGFRLHAQQSTPHQQGVIKFIFHLLLSSFFVTFSPSCFFLYVLLVFFSSLGCRFAVHGFSVCMCVCVCVLWQSGMSVALRRVDDATKSFKCARHIENAKGISILFWPRYSTSLVASCIFYGQYFHIYRNGYAKPIR